MLNQMLNLKTERNPNQSNDWSTITERSIGSAGLFTQKQLSKRSVKLNYRKLTKASVPASKFSISHTELTVSRSRDYKHNTASFENAVSNFPRHRFGKGHNMHTDKRIDENYSPRTAISPRLIREDLSEKTSLGGELAGGEMVSWWRVGWWRDSLVAR